MAKVINFNDYNRVHFLGAGGIKKSNIIKNTLGNCPNFSVDNTTPYNRSIDGSIYGTAYSGYFDYITKKLTRITPSTINDILKKHQEACNRSIAYFSYDDMRLILNGILMHQSQNNSPATYESRAKLIMHNFDVFRFNAE